MIVWVANNFFFFVLCMRNNAFFTRSYAGHGSGLPYYDIEKMKENHIESVVCLYGCESLAMKKIGQAELLTAKKLLEIAHW